MPQLWTERIFHDAAEGLLTSVILLISEYCPKEQRHIVSVFKLIQDLLAPSPGKREEPVPAAHAETASRPQGKMVCRRGT